MNGTGPDGRGAGTGRKAGRCSSLTDKEKLQVLGKGLGRMRHADPADRCSGKGRRIRYDQTDGHVVQE